MEHYEMAELLSKKANVSLEEAREVLSETDWDILDAMVALERRHKGAAEPVVVDRAGGGEDYSEPQPVKNAPKKDPIITNGFAQIWHYVKRLAQLSVQTEFTIINRRDRIVLNMPVLVLVILLACCFWFMLPLLVVGLFFGFQYRFEGKRAAAAANRAMDKLGVVVENIKDSLDNDEVE